ncbi:MAG: hypothetical protein H6719_20315 [Sandaracinaceae bacterium]|nr:hypothetical protein [Sandaracinaceae bacterium]
MESLARIGLALALAASACASSPRGVASHREGWLGALLEDPGPLRPIAACERRFAPATASSFRLDVHPHAGQERVLVGDRSLVIVDAACERALSSHALAPFEPNEIGLLGPTLEDPAWTRLSDEERARLHATDAVGAGLETRVGLLPVRGADRPGLVILFEGATRGARSGYHAVFVRCRGERACARVDLAHVEITGAGSAACDRYRVAVAREDGLDTPLLWIVQPRPGVLELRQLSLDRRAGPDCPPSDGPTLRRTVTRRM